MNTCEYRSDSVTTVIVYDTFSMFFISSFVYIYLMVTLILVHLNLRATALTYYYNFGSTQIDK